MSLLEKVNRFPPFLCRMMARTGRGMGCRPLRLDEIAQRASLDISTVSKLSKRRKWDKEPLWVVFAFSDACGVDLLHPRRHIDFLKRKKRFHLNSNPTYWARLLESVKDDPIAP